MYERESELHRELWAWIVEHPDLCKEEWPRWKTNNGDVDNVHNDCFACDIARKIVGKDRTVSICVHCPINWKLGRQCLRTFSTWFEFLDAVEDGNWERAKKMARKIMNAKWKG